MFWPEQMCDIEVATLFLMLVSGITRIVFGFEREIYQISCQEYEYEYSWLLCLYSSLYEKRNDQRNYLLPGESSS